MTSPQPLTDAEARHRIETALDTSLLVEAAAGTGKTTQLIRRLVAVLEHGQATVDGLVAVTFTRKAAGELKLRLRQQLDERRTVLAGIADGKKGPGITSASDPLVARQRLEEALARLEEAHIGTIHAFCADILRQRPVEAGIDPGFAEVDEDESARIYDRAFRGWIERRLEERPEGLRRALSRLASQRAPDGASPIDRLRNAGRTLVDWRDFDTPWRREPFDRAVAIDRLFGVVGSLAELYGVATNPRDYLRRALEPAEALRAWWAATQTVAQGRSAHTGNPNLGRRERDDDEAEARLIGLLRELRRNVGWKGRGRWYADGVERDSALATRKSAIESLDAFRREADADLAALLRAELGTVVDDYEALKRQRGRVDFLDLLLATRRLIVEHAAVRQSLQQRYSHIFVDEFQDTDPLQAEILLLLAADDPAVSDWREVRPAAGKLFLVGDPKQSIYRFRRADVAFFQDLKDRLFSAGVEGVFLTRSFRSVAPVQHAVNAAFAPIMTGDREEAQARYVPLDPVRPAPTDRPSLVALPVPAPYNYNAITGRAVEAGQPSIVAAWISWLIDESGWTIDDPDTHTATPIRPRHIAILFRRFMSWGRDVSRAYTRALEERGVPHLLVGGRSFHQREEVETLRAALVAVEWPEDELAVFATLKGGLFAVPDDVLLRFRESMGRLHPFRQLPADLEPGFAPIVDALRLLRRLHIQRNHVPMAETVRRLLEATRAYAGFALRPAGNQVLANAQRIRELARSFERRGGLSFRGFVERLNDEAEGASAGYAPALEEGADGVRIMTVHAAKGLEFPIVILADITARLTPFEANRHIDSNRGLHAERLLGCAPWELLDQAEREKARDTAEGVRLAYVAATRARDLLAIPAVGDKPFTGGWTEPLNRVIYPPENAFRSALPAPGCPPFGPASVLSRPQRFDGETECSVQPGSHTSDEGSTTGSTTVVWWDPALLGAPEKSRLGLHQEQILSPDDAGADSDGLRSYRAWKAGHLDAVDRGSEPSRKVAAVGDAGEPSDLYLLDVQVERVPRQSNRPAGPRFGTLVHQILRDVPFDAEEAAISALARLHGRVLMATDCEVEAAVGAVAATLGHPLLRAAANAESHYREAPFLVPDDNGTVIEGTLDLAFRNADGSWVVIDFKTDIQVAGLEERYRAQVAWYVSALQRLTGSPARGVLLSV